VVAQTKYLPLCDDYLPGFPVSHIGFSTLYARQFFSVPNISFNMLQAVLVGPLGAKFLRKAKKLDRPVYAWTVNKENRMRWCIRKELDGVITDDPKLFLKVCEDEERLKKKEWMSFYDLLDIIKINLMVLVFGIVFMRKHRGGVDKRFIRRRTGTGSIEN